MQSVAG
jgi:hypothetical protein